MTYDNQPGGYMPAPNIDHEGTRGPVARPKALDTAVKLMWAGGVLQLLAILPSFFMQDQMRDAIREQLEATDQEVTDAALNAGIAGALIFSGVIAVVGAALWFLHAWANGKGKNWARISATVLGVLNIVFTLISFVMPMAATTTLALVFSVINLLIAIAALYFMWRKENNPFYAAH